MYCLFTFSFFRQTTLFNINFISAVRIQSESPAITYLRVLLALSFNCGGFVIIRHHRKYLEERDVASIYLNSSASPAGNAINQASFGAREMATSKHPRISQNMAANSSRIPSKTARPPPPPIKLSVHHTEQ